MRDGDEVNVEILSSSLAKLIKGLLGDWIKNKLVVFEFQN
jgi:hypothetical protein